MSDFDKLRPHMSTITLTLDKTTLDYAEQLTGCITIHSQEDLIVERIILEILVMEKMRWQDRTVISQLHRHPIVVGRTVTIARQQQYELPFAIDLPFYSRPNPYMDLEVGINEYAHVKDRKDIRRDASHGPKELAIRFPYVIKCAKIFGGCGFTSPSTMELVRFCPVCGKNQEDIWEHQFTRRSETWTSVTGQRDAEDDASTP